MHASRMWSACFRSADLGRDVDPEVCYVDILTDLSCCVDDLRREFLASVAYQFAEGVLDGGVVGFDEVAVDVLDCEGGFAWRSLVSAVERRASFAIEHDWR